MMSDLVLKVEGERYCQNVHVNLPNIQGQRYVFGSEYPGEREGEEFIFSRNELFLVDSTHCTITVDKQGQYLIQNDTTNFKTFVNGERLLLEPRLLKFWDTVLLEDSDIGYGYAKGDHYPIFQVKERIFPAWSGQEIEGDGSDSDSDYYDGDNDSDNGSDNDGDDDIEALCKAMTKLDLEDRAESPLDNSLIIEKIMGYLPVRDLKNARLVSKKWRAEATKSLEKKGKVSFYFTDYLNPEYSTRVFRYLHEVKGLRIRNLRISLEPIDAYRRTHPSEPRLPSPGIFGQKKLDDLRKLLKSSHNFSTLFLSCEPFICPSSESEFVPFHLLFQELGEKLVELELTFSSPVFPVLLPQLPVMTNLKKFTHYGRFGSPLNPKWISSFVPLFSGSLEHFTCSTFYKMAEGYFQEFLEHPTPNLKGIALEGEPNLQSLSALLELETPLTSLEIQYSIPCSELEELLKSLFLKNSKSLQHLILRIGTGYDYNPNQKGPEIKFPSFPTLKVLEVEYGHAAQVGWDTELDYGNHLPSLRKLTVKPLQALQPWSGDDRVFKVFFRRQEQDLRCNTVKEVWVPVLRKPNLPSYGPRRVSLDYFQPTMDRIRKMFPSAGIINFFE